MDKDKIRSYWKMSKSVKTVQDIRDKLNISSEPDLYEQSLLKAYSEIEQEYIQLFKHINHIM